MDSSTFDEERNEHERILRERGFDPDELTVEEQQNILNDSLDDNPDNDRLGNIIPGEEQDGTDT